METIWLWIISALAIFISARIIPGVQSSVGGALVTSIVLGLLNMLVKPILLFLALPINILSLGLFTLVINAFIILLAGRIVPGFKVAGFLQAFIFGIVLAIIQMILGSIFA